MVSIKLKLKNKSNAEDEHFIVLHALTMAEIESFKNVDCEGDIQLPNAKNYFLFSFYARGMNFADMMRLRWSDITQTRITYARSKTQGNFTLRLYHQ